MKKKRTWYSDLLIIGIWLLFAYPLINLFQIYGAAAALIIIVLYFIIRWLQNKGLTPKDED